MSPQPLAALTKSAIQQIRDELESTPSPNAFLSSATAIANDTGNLLPLPMPKVGSRSLLLDGGASDDAANSRTVFEDIGRIDRSNASDPRLWAHLAFVTYRGYMENRWPLSKDGKPLENWRGRVAERWVFQRSSRNALARHGIARLWWAAELSVVDGSDPYRLTAALIGKQDALIAIVDRTVGGLPLVRRAVLEKLAGTPFVGGQVKNLMRDLTLEHGVRDLSLLPEGEVALLVDDLWS